MAKFLARRWRRQPQMPVQVDWGNPLTKELAWCEYGFRNTAVAPAAVTRNNMLSAKTAYGDGAISADYNALNPGADIRCASGIIAANASCTLFVLARYLTLGVWNEQHLVGLSNSTSTNLLFRIQIRISGASTPYGWTFQYRSDSGSGYTNLNDSVAPNIGEKAFCVASIQGSVATFYKDKQLIGTAGLAGTYTPNQAEIGALVRTSPAQWFGGVIPIAGVYRRELSSGEVMALTENPWQLLRPRRSTIYSLPSAGGVNSAGIYWTEA